MKRSLYSRSRSSSSRGAGAVLLILALLLLSAAFLAGGCSDLDHVVVDLGPASAVTLENLWREVAEEGKFDAGGAPLTRLRLEYAPSGWLVSVVMEASTSDGRSVVVNWRGSYGPDEQTVRVSATMVPGARPSPIGISMLDALTAIDRMGPKNMIEVVPASTPGGFYFVYLQQELSGEEGLDPRAPAYAWSDGGFVELRSDDQRREAGAFLALYPMAVTERSNSTASAVSGEASRYSTSLRSKSPIFFALLSGT